MRGLVHLEENLGKKPQKLDFPVDPDVGEKKRIKKKAHLLDVPDTVRQEVRRCSTRAKPYRREAVRLLDVPNAVRPQEQRCPTRAEPHRREAARLLDVPNARTTQARQQLTQLYTNPMQTSKVHTDSRVVGVGGVVVIEHALQGSSHVLQFPPKGSGEPGGSPGDTAGCIYIDPGALIFLCGSATRPTFPGTSGPTRARSRTVDFTVES